MGFFTTILAALRFHAGAPPVDATFRRGARAYADATVTWRASADVQATHRARTDAVTTWRASADG